MMNCIVCNNKNYPVCKNCKKNPFRIEEARHFLALSGDIDELRSLYSKELPEIKNLNTSRFWNKKLKNNESIFSQDGMTKDRIKIVSSMLCGAKKILDIGAGHGYLEEYLASKRIYDGLSLYANDLSSESVKNLKSRFEGYFEVQSIYRLKYRKIFFDAICCLEVLEHVPPSRVLSVLKKIRILLKKEGIFILSVPTNEGLEKMQNNSSGHVRTYTIPIIKAELEMAGFCIKKVKTLYAFKDLYKLKKNTSRIFSRRWKPNNIIIQSQLV